MNSDRVIQVENNLIDEANCREWNVKNEAIDSLSSLKSKWNIEIKETQDKDNPFTIILLYKA